MSESVNMNPSGDSAAAQKERRTPMEGSWAALIHINKAAKDKVRTTDKTTGWFLVIAVVAVLSVGFVPAAYTATAGMLTDIALGLAVLSFFINRFGIMVTLNDRQTILIWDLMIAAFLGGLYFALNLCLFILISRAF